MEGSSVLRIVYNKKSLISPTSFYQTSLRNPNSASDLNWCVKLNFDQNIGGIGICDLPEETWKYLLRPLICSFQEGNDTNARPKITLKKCAFLSVHHEFRQDLFPCGHLQTDTTGFFEKCLLRMESFL